jgi:hypothetical protein
MNESNQDNPSQNALQYEDVLSSYEKMRQEAKDRARVNRNLILKLLQKKKATHVIVSYSGSGDSGQIDSVDIYRDKDVINAKGAIKVLGRDTRWNVKANAWDEKIEHKILPLDEALREFVYDWIESEHAGWENNDGASGECTIDVSKGTFTLGHTSYYTESDYMESSL